jgi:hypothetical protein
MAMHDSNTVARMEPIAAAAMAAIAAVILCGLAAPTAEAAAGKPRVAKATASADGAGAIATATATCPPGGGGKGPWLALSGGFRMTTFGRGVVYESRRIGARSWRVSAQSLTGRVNLQALANCQRGVPKARAITEKVATPGVDQVGPALTAQCPSGRAVSGGFATRPPFAAGEASNTVIDLLPTGTRAWKVRVLSNLPSSVTTFAYCAERGQKPKVVLSIPDAAETQSVADTLANSTARFCPNGRFAPGGGGFRQPAATSSDYFVPLALFQSPAFDNDPRTPRSGYVGNSWHAQGLKVGSGARVTLSVTALCG